MRAIHYKFGNRPGESPDAGRGQPFTLATVGRQFELGTLPGPRARQQHNVVAWDSVPLTALV